MLQCVYHSLDAHIRHCALAGVNTQGRLLISERFPPAEAAPKSRVVAT